MYCIASKLLRYRKRTRRESTKSENISTTWSSFQRASEKPPTTSDTVTFGTATAGIYLPGGLQVDGSIAYQLRRKLARGGGGSVWIATALEPALKEFGETVIVKIPNSNRLDERAIALFHQEIALMNAFKRSHNIATLLGYSENPYSTVLKYYPHGSLSRWITSGDKTLYQAHAFVKDISLGISLLHSNGVVHCDLKPDNVLIDSGWRLFAVLSDFGISRIVTDKLLKVGAYQVQTIKGASLEYASPEALYELRGAKSASKIPSEIMARDVYAIGIIISALVAGKD